MIADRGLVFGEVMFFIALLAVGFALRPGERGVPMALELPENVVVSKLDELASWCRKNSLWPMPFATACCGIELMATGASKHDLARFGAEVFRFSPRQCDLMIVAGRVVMKMLPVLQRIWQQMHEPKWCISMGACASHRRRVRHLLRRAGDRPLHPGRHVRARLPAAARAVDSSDHRPARQDSARRNDRRAASSTRRRGSSRSGLWSNCRCLPSMPIAWARCSRSRLARETAERSGSHECTRADHPETLARLARSASPTLTASRVSRPDARRRADAASWPTSSRLLQDDRGFDLLVDVTCVDYLELSRRDRSLRPGLPAGEHDDQRAADASACS